MNQENNVIFTTQNQSGIIELNRPAALNALSFDMIKDISGQLRLWEQAPEIKSIIFKGVGDKAFCAGGDMKAVYSALQKGEDVSDYFRAEYNLDRLIFNYPKPTIAWMNGITMGGGYGIAGHCRQRIATEKTRFAMPETRIGFFPDVGSMFHLTRVKNNIGRYLALTGETINASDMMYLELADFYMHSSEEEKIYPHDFISTQNEAPSIAHHENIISEIFGHKNLMDIFAALEKEKSPWAQQTLKILRARSPISLVVTNEHYNRCIDREFNDVIAVDFVLACRFLESPDLREGVRAVLVDKDNSPAWHADSVESLDKQAIAAYFAPSNLTL